MEAKNKKSFLRFCLYFILAIIVFWPFFSYAQESIVLNPITSDPAFRCFGSEARVPLTWSSTISGTPTYDILRKVQGEASFSEIGPTTEVSYIDKPVDSDENYDYKIRVGAVESVPEPASAQYCPPVLYPPTSSCAANGPYLTLNWSPISGTPSIYEVYRDSVKIGQTSDTNFSDGLNIEGTKTYNYFIKAVWQNGTSRNSDTASAVALTCPPTLNASADCLNSAPGGPKVNLSWNSLKGVQNYQIYRKAQAETDFSLLQILTDTNYQDNLVESLPNYSQGGQISYYIKAVWLTDQKDSDIKQITISRCSPFLTVVTNCDEFSFRLSWTNTLGATLYDIYRDGDFLCQIGTSCRDQEDKLIPATATFAFDFLSSEICPGKICDHTYSIKAQVPGFSSFVSNPVLKSIDCATVSPPSPSPVLAAPITYCVSGDSRIKISWTPSDNVNYYDIYRNGVHITPLLQILYEDNAVQSGVVYAYYINAIGMGGSSATSDSQTITAVDCIPPSTPTLSLSTSCENSQSYINLSWSTTTNTLSYEIYRGSSLTNLALLTTLDKSVLSWKDTGISSSTSYYYKVIAKGPSGVSSTSSDIKAIISQSCLPTIPSLFLTPACETGNPVVNLSWATDEANTTRYEIFRNPPFPGVDRIYINDPQVKTWKDISVSPETTYNYKVEAVGPSGRSTQGYKSITTYNCSPPGSFTLNEPNLYCQGSSPRVDLSWTLSSNSTSYNLYRTDVVSSQTTTFTNVVSPFTDWGFNNALRFDGIDDYVRVPHSSVLDLGYTVEAWIQPVGLVSGQTEAGIVEKLSWTNKQGYYLQWTNNKEVSFTVLNGSSWKQALAPVDSVPLDQWSHIVGIYDGSFVRVYVNGILKDSEVQTGAIAPNTNILTIGAESSGYKRFNGIIDEVRIYDRALSPAEITEHYKGIFSDETKLIGLWHFDEGTGQYASDSSSYGNNGTLGSSSSVESKDPTWVLNELQSGTKYKWQSRAFGPGGDTYSNYTSQLVMPACPPTKPGLVLTSFCETGTNLPAVNLKWSYTTATTRYEIYRQDKELIKTINQGDAEFSSRTWTDNKGLTNGTNYIYYIRAIGPTNLSNQSDSISVIAPSCLAPTKPENLQSSFSCGGATNSNPQVNLSWNPSQNATYYTIYREPSLFPFPVTTTATSYTDTAVNTNSTYSYYVIAYGPGGNSPPSDLVIITTGYCVPSTPSITSLTTDCESFSPTNTISWSDPDVEARQIFNNGFEKGDFSKWTGTDSAFGVFSVSSDDPYQGIYHAKFVSNNVDWWGHAYGYYNLSTLRTSLYLRAYYKFDSLPQQNGPDYGYTFNWMSSPQSSNLASVVLWKDVPNNKYFWRLNFKGSAIDSVPFTPQINTWYSIELYARVATVAGEAKLWINGELKASLSGVGASSDTQINQIQARISKNDPPAVKTFKIDSVIVSDRYIGLGVPIYNTDKYKIYRNTTGILPTEADLIKTITTSDPEFLERAWKDESGLNNKQQYYYWVRLVGPAGMSILSNQKSVTAYYCDTPPTPFLKLDSLFCRDNSPYATLSWTTNSDATSYNLYRTNPDASSSTYSTRISPLTDKGSFALKFDGVNDYAEIKNAPSLNNFNTGLTVEVWGKQTSYTGGSDTWLLNKDYTGYRIWGLDKLTFWVKTPTQNWIEVLGPTLNLNQWYHLVGVVDNINLKAYLYINGQLSTTVSLPEKYNFGNWDLPLILGRHNLVNRFWPGIIDEVRIYGRALSPAEANEHYQGIYKNEAELRGAWHFDGGEGVTLLDSSGNGNNGKIAGPVPATGQIGGALEFGGLNGHVNVPHSASLDIKTIETWFNSKNWETVNLYSSTIFNKYTDSNNMFRIAFDDGASGKIFVSAKKDGVEIGRNGTTGVSLNEWHHLVVVFTNPVKIYLDKINITSATSNTWSRYSGANNLYIGSRGDAGYFNGLIDEVRIYNRTLSLAEITEHYDGIFSDENGLAGLWHFNEESEETAYDSSPFDNDGTLIKGAEWDVPSDAPTSVFISVLASESLYKYHVKAIGVGTESGSSNEISFNTLSCQPVKPVLVVTAGCDFTTDPPDPQLRLSWQADQNTEYWNVYKSRGEEPSESIVTTTLTSYLDGDVESGIDYTYYVTAWGKGVQENSDLITKTVPTHCNSPSKPAFIPEGNVTPQCYGYSSRILTDWTGDPTGYTVSFNVWRKNITQGDPNFSILPTGTGLAAVTTQYLDFENIVMGNIYQYKIEAVGTGEGNTVFSDSSNETTSKECSVPPDPPQLSIGLVKSTADLRIVNLHWTDAGPEKYYKVWREGSELIEIRVPSEGDTSEEPTDTYWIDSSGVRTLDDNHTYQYKITAYNDYGDTDSDTEIVLIPTARPGDFILSGSWVDNGVHLVWTKAESTLAGGPVTYKVWRGDPSTDFPTSICTVTCDLACGDILRKCEDNNSTILERFYVVIASNNSPNSTESNIIEIAFPSPVWKEIPPW